MKYVDTSLMVDRPMVMMDWILNDEEVGTTRKSIRHVYRVPNKMMNLWKPSIYEITRTTNKHMSLTWSIKYVIAWKSSKELFWCCLWNPISLGKSSPKANTHYCCERKEVYSSRITQIKITFKIWNSCISSCQIQCSDHVFVAIQGRDV